jgi:putative ABC transport system permease protein
MSDRAPSPGRTPLALWPLVLREWQHHPWRLAVAVLAVALGVALAWSVHLINNSALSEFSAAVRSANGEPDSVVRGPGGGFDDALLDRVATLPGVARASPVVEFETYARRAAAAPAAEGSSSAAPLSRLSVRVVGLDALAAAPLTPGALPQPAAGSDRLALLDPGLVFVNGAAREGLQLRDGDTLALQSGPRWQTLRVGGSVAAGGTPLLVVDIAAAQALFGFEGRLSRIDLRLEAGSDVKVLEAALPAGLRLTRADEAEQRVSQMSRAYRVNLTVLALVALFVGGFLVYSVVALSVAQRTPTLALLGVMGLTAGGRRALVLAECGAIGLAGSALGLALGTALAAVALRWLAGDLGGGYFPGIAPALQVQPLALAGFALLGLASALAGGWVPARRAEALQPAVALKGLGGPAAAAPRLRWPLALVAAGGLLALAPPLFGLPVAAYASVAALLVGGVALVPAAVHALLAAAPRPRGALALLALQRARFQRHTATAAVAGVVASLALSVALTVMVTSFRAGVSAWLDRVLPADLYARTAASSTTADQAWLEPDFVAAVQALPGVRQVEASRVRALPWAPGQPTVTLIARDLADPAAALPLLEPPLPPAPAGAPGVDIFVSEAMVRLHGAVPGSTVRLPLDGRAVPARVRGVWRDYARQFGAVAIDAAAYRALTGDTRVNDLAIRLAPGASLAAVQAGLRAAAPDPAMIEFATTEDLRRLSMAIFDRSFAVTYYLQAVAIGIGLIGVAASLSAQVLARRKEFGLLAHLGLTRGQVVGVVAGESAAWLAAGAAVGLLLGLAISVVLVHVVNPQSFHWTMELVLPWLRLAALCAAVIAAGVATAAFSARGATRRSAVLSVREDW